MTAEEIKQRLQIWHDQAEHLMTLFDAHHRITSAQRPQAKTLFAKLKEELKMEHTRFSSGKAQSNLSAAEQSFYLPAINEAWVKGMSSVRADSTPNANWYNALEEVSFLMHYYQNGLTD
jgi:hypothetical protein